jgi:pyruvate dehydrogenase E2 component (dihydrolipoamide acetyltransferase)
MNVVVPAIADDLQELEILALLVRVGQHVLAEQPILELEAGKASFELPSPATGKIEEILVGIGDDVKVGDVVLTLRTLEDGGRSDSAPHPAGSANRSAAEVEAEPEPCTRAPELCVRVSPAARQRARELDIDLDALAADHDGHVTLEQVEARAGKTADPADASVAELDDIAYRATHEQPIADWRSVPHTALHRTVDVTCLEAARRRYRDDHESAPRLTLTAFVLKACAIALHEHPRMNSSLLRHGRALAIKRYVHIGVAINNGRAHAMPVIEHVDRRSLCELADELEQLLGAGAPSLDPLAAPTFSVTNLRKFGGTGFTPLIHPPQVGALGMCRARNEAGRTLLPLSLAYDRRVNDDAAANAFLTTVTELLHDPVAMLVRA